MVVNTARAMPARAILGAALALTLGSCGIDTTTLGDAAGPSGEPVDDSAEQSAVPVRSLTELPTPGRLLVASVDGVWTVSRSGEKQLLPGTAEASWSPHGLYVVATDGGGEGAGTQLMALEPDGDVKWRLEHSERIFNPRWAPSGYRIAYLIGRALRVVAGDGTRDRLVSPRVDAVAPAWRQAPASKLFDNPTGVGTHQLAYVGEDGWIRMTDVDSGERLWRRPPGVGHVISLSWSADGRRLLVVTTVGYRLLSQRGQLLLDMPEPGLTNGELSPDGETVALLRGDPQSRQELIIKGLDRDQDQEIQLFAGRGPIVGPQWSPNGRWLLLDRRRADQWLFFRLRDLRTVAVNDIAGEFDAADRGSFDLPRVLDWCCDGRGEKNPGADTTAEDPRSGSAPGPTLFLAGSAEMWVVAVNDEQVEHVKVPELGGGDPPHFIASVGDRLVLWNYDVASIPASDPSAPAETLAEGGWIFIPGADPNRIWVGFLDSKRPNTARRLGELREIDADGDVITRGVEPPDGAWPYAELTDGLLFQGLGPIRLWDPDTERTVRTYPLEQIGDMGPVHGNQLASCLPPCEQLILTDFVSGEQRRIAAPEGFALAAWEATFSPDGTKLAVPVKEAGGGWRSWSTYDRQLALVDLEDSTTEIVAGSEIPPGYVFTAWSSDGASVFITGGGPRSDREIISYRVGDESARKLDVRVGSFWDVAAG